MPELLSGVKQVIAIASGKGGVGKSMVTANLAFALARDGNSVGILDADIYGPSIPRMLGIREKPVQEGNRIVPVQHEGLRVMSMAFFMSDSDAAILRGPMLHSLMQQLTKDVAWGDLDYLLIDLPPGTGDVQLSLTQTLKLTGAIIVSTPEDVALHVAGRAIAMCRKLNTPIIGMIENMSHYVCGQCGHRENIFGSGAVESVAGSQGVPLLGQIPLTTAARLSRGRGRPMVVSEPDSDYAKGFSEITSNLRQRIKSRSGMKT